MLSVKLHRLRASANPQLSGTRRPRVDREGYGRINGLSIATLGEARGHEFELDRISLEQIARTVPGAKGRWTHGHLCEDGLGKHLGRIDPASVRLQGDHVLGDFVFSARAHDFQPDGLTVSAAEYLMRMAEDEPDTIGLSIVFRGESEEIEDGRMAARVEATPRVDFVADPAANPLGLFAGTGSELSASATQRLDEIIEHVGLERAVSWAQTYLQSKGAQLMPDHYEDEKKDDEMAEPAGAVAVEDPQEEDMGAAARERIMQAEQAGYSTAEIAEATGRAPEVVDQISAGEVVPSSDFVERMDSLLGQDKQDEDTQEEMSAARRGLRELRSQLASVTQELRNAQQELATFRAEAKARRLESIDGYIAELSAKSAEAQAPISAADLEAVREMFELSQDDAARKLGAALLRTSELQGRAQRFERAQEPEQPIVTQVTASQQAARYLKAAGWSVSLSNEGDIENATPPKKKG